MTETDVTGEVTADLAKGVPDRGVGLAYGEVQNLGGVDFVPVAFVSYGFGAAEGSAQFGSGGGGGGVAIPIGAYVGSGGSARFEPNTVALVAAAIPLISALGWAISLIVRAAR